MRALRLAKLAGTDQRYYLDQAERRVDHAESVASGAEDYRQWPELFPPLSQAVLDGAADADAKLVFADTLYMYGQPDGPMTEEMR